MGGEGLSEEVAHAGLELARCVDGLPEGEEVFVAGPRVAGHDVEHRGVVAGVTVLECGGDGVEVEAAGKDGVEHYVGGEAGLCGS